MKFKVNFVQSVVNGIQGLGYAFLSLQGEYLKSIHDRSWMSGHLCDFALPAAMVSVGNLYSFGNKTLEAVTTLVPPILCTLHELDIINLSSSSRTYDSQDIVCYWAGAACAFGLSKIAKSKSVKNLVNRLIRRPIR
jgi:hypothetical protein